MPDTESDSLSPTRQMLAMSEVLVWRNAERSLMNAERTLSVWVRTALGLMIGGLAFERFGVARVWLANGPWPGLRMSNELPAWIGVALVAIGAAAALTAGLRFHAVAAKYRSRYAPPFHHGPALGTAFAAALAALGAVVVALTLAAGR
ncbi:MAG: DUF202 domain-containing protein [Alphaproteobacteria bacterium]|nr:DUF202 domain-containing protein [Alphaproteobacteria bacterium]